LIAVSPGPARLTVDLKAIVTNYRRLCRLAGPGEVAAVVKADAYGLGAVPVATALARAGCRTFFVARLAEGLALRPAIPDRRIFILDGLGAGGEEACARHDLLPVLNQLHDVVRWVAEARRLGRRLQAALHVDTGMCRLGLSMGEARRVAAAQAAEIEPVLVMSHLACAEERDNPLNERQLERLGETASLFPGVPRSLANSSGIYLGAAWRLDLCRPGAALYGVNPIPDLPNPMLAVVRLEAPVLQVHEVDAPGSVGYGATYATQAGMVIATVPVGYADGLPRGIGPGWTVRLHGREMPLAGRVSMDLTSVDVSAVVRELVGRGDMVELIGGPDGVDRLAAAAGTIGYEVLTRLGRRFERVYLEDGGAAEP
jgi:alanine racemase